MTTPQSQPEASLAALRSGGAISDSAEEEPLRIAYLVPEFPGQTHAFFWRERNALRRLGVTTRLVSTRRPAKAVMSHAWSNQAQMETFYLGEFGLRSVLPLIWQFLSFGPVAWVRTARVAVQGASPRDVLVNVALVGCAVRLVGFARANRLQHVHCHSCASSALIAMFANRLAGVSYSLTLHGDINSYGRQQAVKWRHAAFAIAITGRLREQVRLELGSDLQRRVGVAPMGVDVTVFKRATPYLPWNGGGPLRLFSCARLHVGKGHQELIRAVATLRDSGAKVQLIVAGEDEMGGRGYRRRLEALIEELRLEESVVLLGAVPEQRVVAELQSAHIFVLASRDEALGVAIMEAMSCEVPVIATDIGGIQDLVERDIDGLLAPPNNPVALAAAIGKVAADPKLAEQFSRRGREKVMRRYGSDVSALELKRLLEQSLRERDPPPVEAEPEARHAKQR